MAFHWITAALVLFQIWLGFSFADMAKGPERANLFTWHRTIGALILLVVLARLTYRLFNPPPPYPPELPRWERVAGDLEPPPVLSAADCDADRRA